MADQLTFFAPQIPMYPSDWPEDYQSQFWSEYPLKISKRSAMRALDKAKDRDVRWAELINGVRRYVRWLAEPHWRPSPKHPATWLNGDCWEDVLTPGGNGERISPAQRARELAGKARELQRDRRNRKIGYCQTRRLI